MSALTQICPFCSLHCDDVRQDQGSDALSGQAAECPIAKAAFAGSANRRGRIEAEHCDRDQTLRHAQGLFADVAEPTVLASLVDLATARVLQATVAAGRIRVFVEQSRSESAIRASMVRDGMISGTLGDVRKHADLVWIVGDISATAPRFVDEIVRTKSGPVVHEFAGGVSVDEIAALSAAVETQGRQRDTGRIAGLLESLYGPVRDQSEPDDQIFAARYFAVVLAANAFDDDAALAAAAMLNRSVMKLNEQTRAVIVSLDAAATLRSVSAWSQNRSLQAWDRAANSSALLVSGIRIGGPRTDIVGDGSSGSDESERVAVQIGGIDAGPASATCYLPASIPGVDRDGLVIRGDGSISLPLAGSSTAGGTDLQSAGELLAALLA